MSTMLSKYFSYEELTTTQIRGVDNTPDAEHLENLKHTAWQLDIVRHILKDNPIHINSGYRSPEVNARIGGSKTSAHSLGHAADLICPQFGDPKAICEAIRDSGLRFDQLIYEGTWVHISFDPKLRGQMMTAHFPPNGPTQYTLGF